MSSMNYYTIFITFVAKHKLIELTCLKDIYAYTFMISIFVNLFQNITKCEYLTQIKGLFILHKVCT